MLCNVTTEVLDCLDHLFAVQHKFTPSNFASITLSSGRQHDPQHEAGMWRLHVLDQLAVLDTTNSQSHVSHEDKVSLLSSVLVSTQKATHTQSSPAVPC